MTKQQLTAEVNRLTQERDAALAEVARLTPKLGAGEWRGPMADRIQAETDERRADPTATINPDYRLYESPMATPADRASAVRRGMIKETKS